MARVKDEQMLEHIKGWRNGIPQAAAAAENLRVALEGVNARWAGYASIEDNHSDLAFNQGEFVQRVTDAWILSKPDLIAAFTILAGGMGTDVADLLIQLGNGEVQRTPPPEV